MQTDISAEKFVYEIIPGILEKDWESIERKIELVRPFAKTIHVDIIDGKFVDNTTFMDPKPFAKYTKDIFFELHMMVEDPIQYLKPWADVGFRRFIGHVEKMPSQEDFVAQGQILGEVGLALDGTSGMEEIQIPLDDLDVLVAMSIKAGFSGQKYTPEFVEKLEIVKDTTWIPIEVDGGIQDSTIVQAKELGVTRFIANSFLFNGNPKAQYEKLLKVLE